jgi:16S rRNA (cytidine1402-2'-O)-methyltransferase
MHHLKPGLYIVATPIGHLKDITIRAIETLQASDYILCEDTRITRILLQKYNIHTKLMLYNDHSTQLEREKILSIVKNGSVVSLVSDAGTPMISDPGYKVVNYLQQNGCFIDVIPGPSAVIAAICLAGMASDKFMFLGFMPRSLGEKTTMLQKIAHLDATLVFFEAAPRILESLKVTFDVLGNRICAIVREITKIHQEVIKDTLENLITLLEKNPLKGEIVLIVDKGEQSFDEREIVNRLNSLIQLGISKSDAVKAISAILNLKKTHVYNLAKDL